MKCPKPSEWEKDEKGYYVWSGTNGDKRHIYEYIQQLELEAKCGNVPYRVAMKWREALEKIVEWDKKYPKDRIYSMGVKDKIEGELQEIIEIAKAALPEE